MFSQINLHKSYTYEIIILFMYVQVALQVLHTFLYLKFFKIKNQACNFINRNFKIVNVHFVLDLKDTVILFYDECKILIQLALI